MAYNSEALSVLYFLSLVSFSFKEFIFTSQKKKKKRPGFLMKNANLIIQSQLEFLFCNKELRGIFSLLIGIKIAVCIIEQVPGQLQLLIEARSRAMLSDEGLLGML